MNDSGDLVETDPAAGMDGPVCLPEILCHLIVTLYFVMRIGISDPGVDL